MSKAVFHRGAIQEIVEQVLQRLYGVSFSDSKQNLFVEGVERFVQEMLEPPIDLEPLDKALKLFGSLTQGLGSLFRPQNNMGSGRMPSIPTPQSSGVAGMGMGSVGMGYGGAVPALGGGGEPEPESIEPPEEAVNAGPPPEVQFDSMGDFEDEPEDPRKTGQARRRKKASKEQTKSKEEAVPSPKQRSAPKSKPTVPEAEVLEREEKHLSIIVEEKLEITEVVSRSTIVEDAPTLLAPEPASTPVTEVVVEPGPAPLKPSPVIEEASAPAPVPPAPAPAPAPAPLPPLPDMEEEAAEEEWEDEVDVVEKEAALSLADDAWGDFSLKEAEGRVEKILRRKGVVRSYTQMNPGQIFPLVVSIVEAEMYIKLPDLPDVQQIESEQVLAIKESSPLVRIVPVMPGCLISPPEIVVDVRKEKVDAEFRVAPQAEGDLREFARIQLWHEGALKDEIPIPCRVRTQTLTRLMSYSSVLTSFAGALLDTYGKNIPALQSSDGQDGGAVGALIRGLVSMLSSSGVWLGLFFFLVAVGCYFWLRPKRGDVIEKFLNTELH